MHRLVLFLDIATWVRSYSFSGSQFRASALVYSSLGLFLPCLLLKSTSMPAGCLRRTVMDIDAIVFDGKSLDFSRLLDLSFPFGDVVVELPFELNLQSG
jgi:hypothetical protein